MAKLNAKLAAQVDTQETSSFEALPAGTYTARLMDVETRTSANGNQVWSWTYEVTEPEQYRGRRLWDSTALTERALWRLKAVFDAFGVGADTDTDEMLGSHVRLVVAQREIPTGKRAGEMGNEIRRLLPAKNGLAGATTLAAVPTVGTTTTTTTTTTAAAATQLELELY